MSDYVSRIITPVFVAFVIAALMGPSVIEMLKKLKAKQTEREEGLESHKKKQGTPTMGGFMFIISTVITAIAGYWIYRWKVGVDTTDKKSFYPFYLMLGCILFSAAFGIIGFIDDYTKVARKNNDGLTAKQKIALQLVFSVGFLAVIHFFGDGETRIDLGFWKSPSLGIFYYILMMAVIIYLTNAVNLTDGVDGLCGSVTFVAMLIFTVCCTILKKDEMTCFTMALAGGCLGFLLWNLNPAKCFMGDTGSMFLGAAVTGVGLILHKHLLLILVALVYILEALSVMIQVTYFKYTKKKYGEGRRIFKMTPIHHHFEMSGFSEYKIVISFSLFGMIFGVLGIITLLALN
jgi:phospho-N-acetylmuramoyl-pentapeptide-transferase